MVFWVLGTVMMRDPPHLTKLGEAFKEEKG